MASGSSPSESGAPGRRGECRGGRAPEVVDVGEAPRLGDQCGVLPRLRIEGLDLGEPVAQQVGLAGELAGAAATLGQGGDRGPPPPPGLAVGRQRPGGRGAGEAVEHGALLGDAQQPQRLVLAVDGERGLGHVGEHPERHGSPPEVGAGAPVGGDRAHGDEAAVLVGRRPRVAGDRGRPA